MKTFFKVVLFVFVAAFYSCGKDEVSSASSASSSITSAGVISGTISNYGTTKVDSIHFNGSNAIVSTGGKFSSTIAIPKSADLHIFPVLPGVKISDVNALVSELEIVCYHNSQDGKLYKTNMTENMTPFDGAALSVFVYCDRDVVITGSFSGDAAEIVQAVRLSGMVTLDLKLKKGWNEMVGTIEKVSLTTGDVTMKVSNTIPSDLKWVAVGRDAAGTDAAGTASKVKAFKSLLKK
ncbi:MAG TPA: hypothetical protein VIK29_06175 [Paludibacter sp.]